MPYILPKGFNKPYLQLPPNTQVEIISDNGNVKICAAGKQRFPVLAEDIEEVDELPTEPDITEEKIIVNDGDVVDEKIQVLLTPRAQQQITINQVKKSPSQITKTTIGSQKQSPSQKSLFDYG